MILNKAYLNKYRPKKIDGMILLPRIRKELFDENGNLILNNHYLFSGSAGIGKTSLAKIIIPKAALVVNASYNSSVDDLKDKVTEFCKTADIFSDSSIDNYKVVFLDEFDGVSTKYQEALRAFIEEYSDRVRFIATCNNIAKIIAPIQSRFTVFNFDPINQEEVTYLKNEYFDRVKLIADMNDIVINDDQIKSLINVSFPDLRSVLKTLQRIKITGLATISSESNDLFEILFEKKSTNYIYNWVISNYGDNIEPLLKECGRPLSEHIFDEVVEHINGVPQILKVVSNYSTNIQNAVDPLVLGLACIYEIKKILKTI